MAECIRPGEISDDDLIAYAAGERSQRVREHVRACARCAALAAEYTAVDARLSQALYRFDCPSGLELGEYHLGLLPVAQSRRVAAHLMRCPHCSAELATASGFFEEAATVAAPAPVERVRLAARQAMERIIAQLVPAPPMAAAALRGGPRAVTLRYVAEDVTLTLHPQPADRSRGQMQVLGFVERRDAELDGLAGVKARLIDGDGKAAAAGVVDEIGNFILGPVPPGVYALELTLPAKQVVVPDLPLTR
jgi:anti-sigma factor RsiW